MSRFACDKLSGGFSPGGAFTQPCRTDRSTLVCETDDERDSGTESDDEGAEIEELQKYMETLISLNGSNRHVELRRTKKHLAFRQQQQTPVDGDEDRPQSSSPTPRHRHHQHRRRTTSNRSPDAAAQQDSALPSDSDHNFDHHSSEEELEVINSVPSPRLQPQPQPEKRKWGGGHSTDEEELFLGLPVQFRTSPPADAHKPSKCLRQGYIPPHELCSSVSPRKRHRRTSTTSQAVQRPCLDFEKMQQINRVRLL